TGFERNQITLRETQNEQRIVVHLDEETASKEKVQPKSNVQNTEKDHQVEFDNINEDISRINRQRPSYTESLFRSEELKKMEEEEKRYQELERLRRERLRNTQV